MQAFDLYAILPELVLLVVTCLLLVASVYVPERVTSTPGVEQDIFHTPRGVGFVYFNIRLNKRMSNAFAFIY